MNLKEKLSSFLPKSDSKLKAMKGVTWLAGDKLMRLAVSVLTGAMVTRYLGPEQYGTLSSLTAFAALFGPIANVGVNTILLRDVAAHPEHEKRIVNGAIVLKLLGGAIAFVLAVSVALFANQKEFEPMLVVLATFQFLFYFLEALEIWFYAKNNQKIPVIASQISFLSTSLLRIVAILMNWGLPVILLTYALDSVFGGILVFFYARKYLSFRLSEVTYNKETTKELFREARPLILSGLGAIVYMKIDKVIMPWLTSAYALGIYSAATKLSELWYFLPYSVATALSPLIAEAKRKDPELYEKRIRKSLIIVNLLTIAIAAATSIAGPLLIRAYAGDKYITAIDALRVHIWSLPFISMGLIVDIWLLNEHLQKVQVIRTFITAGINIVLNILLVPQFGAVGAAWATLIAYTYPGFLANVLDKRTRTIFWLELKSVLPTRANLRLILEK